MIARNPIRSVRTLKTGLAALGIVALLAGCSSGSKWGFPYKIDVQQGNWITQEQIALLQPGMSREQVRFALGSPMLTSVLHSDRWDYPYYYKPGYGDARERKFTVWFENDRLARWSGDEQPTLQPYQLDEDGKPIEQARPVPADQAKAQPAPVAAEPSAAQPATPPAQPAAPVAPDAKADAAKAEADRAAEAQRSKAGQTPDSDQARKRDEASRQVTPNVVIQPPSSPSPYSPGLPGSDAQPLR